MTHIRSQQLTQAQGLEIQRQQMLRAKRLYRDDVYEALHKAVEIENSKLTLADDGHKVCRGTILDNFCVNWALQNPEN